MFFHAAIASTKARFVWPSGEERLITIEVGAPFMKEEADWRCELDLNGIEGEATAMVSVDSLSALSSALYFLRLRIDLYRNAGIRVLYPDSEQNLLLDVLFPPGLKDRAAPKG